MEIIYDENIEGKRIILTSAGIFTIDNEQQPWYKTPNGRPWIPAKRKSFIGLVKQILKD